MERGNAGCWPIGKAEERIHKYARLCFELAYTDHADEKIEQRGITVADIRHILENGDIHDEPEATKRPGYCKYKNCSRPA